MIRTDELKRLIAYKGYTQAEIAEKLGITPKTLYSKFKIGILDSDEIYKLIEILDIKNPVEIFFAG